MTALSTRVRLMLWYSAVLVFALALFGAASYSFLKKDLMTELDQRLAEKAHGVQTLMELEKVSGPELSEELAELAEELPQGQLLQLVSSSGEVLLPADGKPVFPIELMRRSGAQTAESGRVRVFVAGFGYQGERYTVMAGESLEETLGLMRRVQEILWITAVPVLLLAGLGGYWLSRRALAPVDAMTRAARSISVESLSRRLPEPHTGDEIERLAQAWNELLGRLEASVKRIQQFTADASHELRTPVALIRSTAELALRRERDPQEYRKALEEVGREAERMTELTESLLALARTDAQGAHMPLASVDVNALAEEVARQSERLAEDRGVRLEASVDAHAEAVAQANEAGLRGLLRILVDNALEHTPAGGRVVISVARQNGRVALAVRDSGEGIAPEALPHIFERFYRADPARGGKGAGLGLSIARVIARAHGTEIEVESRPGEGASFRVALRVAAP